jgi:beta-lactam-binding protein with PASTA domain
VAVAKNSLKQQGFDKFAVVDERSPLVQSGLVMGTSPQAGSVVPPSSTITLDVSSGAPLAAVPSLAGQRCGNADTALKSKDFNYTNTPENSNKVASGFVISTKPASGTELQQGNTVDVYCSAGQATTTVPNLQGLNPAQAGEKLGEAHLKAGNLVPVPSATVKSGLVAYSQPYGGNLEPWGTTVTLYVSDGQQMTTVPIDLVGETEQQAQQELAAVNLGAEVYFVPVTNPSEDGYVIGTHPKPGQQIRQGSAVTLYVGEYTGPPTTKPIPTTTTTKSLATTTTTASTTVPTTSPTGVTTVTTVTATTVTTTATTLPTATTSPFPPAT